VSSVVVNPAGMPRHHHALVGICLVIAATACFATLDTTTKFVSTGVPLLMALWFRYAFQAIATTLVVLPTRGLTVLRTSHPRFHLLRGLLLLASTMLAFVSLKHTPVAEFTAIISLTPLVITLLAAYRLKEKVSVLRWALVVGGFVGTVIIIRPHSDDFNWALLLPLTLVGTSAWFQLITSTLARTEDPLTMHFYTGWVGTVIATFILPFVWAQVSDTNYWWAMALVSLAGTVGHFLLILAYKKTTAAVLTPYLYCQIAFAMVGGWLVFAQVPDGWSLFGIAMIAVCGAGGAWLTVRESRVMLDHVES
jgi:drug/metabolite transporter (DMT)-like permease